MGAAILDRKSWGPPSWIWRRDVIDPKVAPILLMWIKTTGLSDHDIVHVELNVMPKITKQVPRDTILYK